MNILLCSVGRRGELIKNFKSSLGERSTIVATDCDPTAPALYIADKPYIVPEITADNYLTTLLEICEREKIKAVTTFIDPEIKLLSENRERFSALGVEVLAPCRKTASICFDKYDMFKYIKQCKIKTVKTYPSFEAFFVDHQSQEIDFPVFVKPRTGSGSVGATKVKSLDRLKLLCEDNQDLIIQEFMEGTDISADVYVDTVQHKPVSVFLKRKLATTIGGANKTISFKDAALFEMIDELTQYFDFRGPIDIDFFYKEGEYYLSEINPRFGGGYVHAHRCGVNFIELISNNIKGFENERNMGDYEENVLMMMYDSVVIRKEQDLA